MALFLGTVMKWQTGKHQNWKRVRDTTNGTQYLLNTYRLDSIRAHGATESSLYYFDNPFNHRDSGCYMEVVKTPAELIAYMDTSQHTHVTLPIFPDNDHTETAVNHVFQTVHIAYAVIHEIYPEHSWVTYTDSGLGIHTVLVNYTPTEIFNLL
jgi:hypothetical protein